MIGCVYTGLDGLTSRLSDELGAILVELEFRQRAFVERVELG